MWREIPCSITQLNLDITLANGQCFRWKKAETGEWKGVVFGKLWILTQNNENILYKVSSDKCLELESKNKRKHSEGFQKKQKKTSTKKDSSKEVSYDDIIRNYFQLNTNLEELYQKWRLIDPVFAETSTTFTGVRILRQDPVENLFSFICSSNNNISRISSMVEKLCMKYGERISIGEEEEEEGSYFAFPTIKSLAGEGVENELRRMGFGYRAKFISQTAKHLLEHQDPSWLNSLRYVPYETARSELIKLPGVGLKVADCVCLMSLDKSEAVPVDTHVWQIACRNYLPHLKKYKSITDKTYLEVGNFFRSLFGLYAGWAHTVLFSADLKALKNSIDTQY